MIFRTLLLSLVCFACISPVTSFGNEDRPSVDSAPPDASQRPLSNASSLTEKETINPPSVAYTPQASTTLLRTLTEGQSSPSGFARLLTVCDPIVQANAPVYSRTSPTFNQNWFWYFDHCRQGMRTQAKEDSNSAQLLQSLYYTCEWFSLVFRHTSHCPSIDGVPTNTSTAVYTQQLVSQLENNVNEDINTFVNAQVKEYHRIQEIKRNNQSPEHYIISHEEDGQFEGLPHTYFDIYSIKRNGELIFPVSSSEGNSFDNDSSTSSGEESSPSGFLRLMDICDSILPQTSGPRIRTLGVRFNHPIDFLFECREKIEESLGRDSNKDELLDTLTSSLYFIWGSLKEDKRLKSKLINVLAANIAEMWDSHLKDMFQSKYEIFDKSIKLQVSEYYQMKKRQREGKEPEHYTAHFEKSRRLVWNSNHKFNFFSLVVNGEPITEVRLPDLSSSPSRLSRFD